MSLSRRHWLQQGTGWFLLSWVGTVALGCQATPTQDYTVAAITTYTWMADYRAQGGNPDRPRDTRTETFANNSLTITNGQRPPRVAGDADEKGLWWPALPPEPTVDELEARQGDLEQVERPRIVQSVTYQITFTQGGETLTRPTQYPVYREALQAQKQGQTLQVNLDPTRSRITQVSVP